MQYSDTSTRQGLIQDMEDLTNLGATGISSDSTYLQQFTRWANIWYHKVITIILDAQDDWDFDDSNKSDYPVATTPLVSGQRDYTFPASLKILKIKRVDVTYDGTNYYKAEAWDSQETGLGIGNDTIVDAGFNKTSPFYDVKANSIWIYPLPNATDVAAGGKIRVEFFREPTEFTTASTTTEPGFDEPFHRMISLGAAMEWAIVNENPIKVDLASMLQDYETRLRRYYGKKNDGRNWQLKPAFVNYE